MTLPEQLTTREYEKFEEVDPNLVAVRVKMAGGYAQFSPSGLRNGGRHSIVTINDTTWTPVPAVPLTDRNALSIQNISGVEIKLNYADDIAGYVGVLIPAGAERQYDITDAIVLYLKSFPGSGSVDISIEELS